jgi:hypothetical protein
MAGLPETDTVGESFELNIASAQEAGTLIGTAKPDHTYPSICVGKMES